MEIAKIGITGHRKLNNAEGMKKNIKNELRKLDEIYQLAEITEVISPLADGADRLVAKILMDDYAARLIVPLPFEKDEYKKDFEEEVSKKEFDDFLLQSSNTWEVGSLAKNTRDECYFNVGKEVVKQCDVLIALWDGVEANGVSKIGGTAYIVDYAKEKNKPILHINIETLKVEYINFEGIL